MVVGVVAGNLSGTNYSKGMKRVFMHSQEVWDKIKSLLWVSEDVLMADRNRVLLSQNQKAPIQLALFGQEEFATKFCKLIHVVMAKYRAKAIEVEEALVGKKTCRAMMRAAARGTASPPASGHSTKYPGEPASQSTSSLTSSSASSASPVAVDTSPKSPGDSANSTESVSASRLGSQTSSSRVPPLSISVGGNVNNMPITLNFGEGDSTPQELVEEGSSPKQTRKRKKRLKISRSAVYSNNINFHINK